MKIRNGFVSNSSSSSFIVIGKNYNKFNTYNDTYTIFENGETEFGWDFTKYDDIDDRINFAFLQAEYIGKEDMVTECIKEATGVKNVAVLSHNGDNEVYAYIDHQSVGDENVRMFANKDTLKRFMFCNDSYIKTGNDNSDADDSWYDDKF